MWHENEQSHLLTALFPLCKVLGPFEEQEEFSVEDFHLLEKITLSGAAEKVKASVKQMGMKPKQYVCIFLPHCVCPSFFNFL